MSTATLLATARGPVECRVEGSDGGLPVVVLHGTPGGIDAAAAMAAFLPRENFRPVLLSRPGYLGTPLDDRLTPDRQADLIAAALDELGIDRAAVLSWSGGGPCGYRFAVRHPDRLSALVAVAAVSQPYRARPVGPSDRPMSGTAVGHALLTAEHCTRPFVLDLSATVATRGQPHAGFDNDLARLADLADLELEEIRAPVLLVQGSADTDLPPEHTDQAGSRIAGARTIILPTGTHLAFWTHPDADTAQRTVVDFLVASSL